MKRLAVFSRLLNTFMYAFAFEQIILQTGISTVGMGSCSFWWACSAHPDGKITVWVA